PLYQRARQAAEDPALDADGQAEARGRVPHLPPDPAPRGRASRRLHGAPPEGLVPHGGLLQARVEPLLPARAREENRHGDDRGAPEAPPEANLERMERTA